MVVDRQHFRQGIRVRHALGPCPFGVLLLTVCVCVNVCAYGMCVCVCCTCLSACVCMCVFISVCVCVFTARVSKCVCVCVYKCVCVCSHLLLLLETRDSLLCVRGEAGRWRCVWPLRMCLYLGLWRSQRSRASHASCRMPVLVRLAASDSSAARWLGCSSRHLQTLSVISALSQCHK